MKNIFYHGNLETYEGGSYVFCGQQWPYFALALFHLSLLGAFTTTY